MLNNPGKSLASADHEGRVCFGNVMGCVRLSGQRVPGAFVREYCLVAGNVGGLKDLEQTPHRGSRNVISSTSSWCHLRLTELNSMADISLEMENARPGAMARLLRVGPNEGLGRACELGMCDPFHTVLKKTQGCKIYPKPPDRVLHK